MGDKAWTPENVLDVFGDPLARRILVLASREPMAADDLADHCDASLPTIYRRVDALAERDLLDEETNVTQDGNHYTTYETTLRRVTFEVGSGGYNVDVQRHESLVDQFESFWSDLDDASPRMAADAVSHPEGDPHVEGNDG